MALIVGMASAAWVAVKTVDAAVQISGAFYFTYAGSSIIGDRLGLWELIAVLAWLVWSLVLTILSFVTASNLFDQTEARVLAAQTEGTYGTGVTQIMGIKGFVLLMVLSMGVMISSWTMGDVADELLNWFNKYQDKTGNEGTTKTDNTADLDGTSFEKDLLYHSITTAYSYIVLTAIMVGGYVFTFQFYTFFPVPSDCEITDVSASTYEPIKTGIPLIFEGTYAECKANMKTWFDIIDVNGDQFVDRCEDAKFLYGVGNTEEYAQNFAGMTNLAELQHLCGQLVPSAFDEIRLENEKNASIEYLISQAYPFNLIYDMFFPEGMDHDKDDDDNADDDN